MKYFWSAKLSFGEKKTTEPEWSKTKHACNIKLKRENVNDYKVGLCDMYFTFVANKIIKYTLNQTMVRLRCWNNILILNSLRKLLIYCWSFFCCLGKVFQTT